MKLENQLFEFWKQKELEWGRDIGVTEVAKAIGASRTTVTRLKSGEEQSRYDASILVALCDYFDVPPGPIPFLVLVPADDEA